MTIQIEYEEAKNLILTFLNNEKSSFPILVVVDNEAKELLEKDFKSELEEFKKYSDEELYKKYIKLSFKVFKICTYLEYLAMRDNKIFTIMLMRYRTQQMNIQVGDKVKYKRNNRVHVLKVSEISNSYGNKKIFYQPNGGFCMENEVIKKCKSKK